MPKGAPASMTASQSSTALVVSTQSS
jgi:hypothetical protein